MTNRKGLEAAAHFGRYINSWRPFAANHYRQDGEDILLDLLVVGRATGCYIDLGARHPYRFSNSYRADCHGRSGVVIDEAPGIKQSFAGRRPRVLVAGECVSAIEGLVDSESALNTTQEQRCQHVPSVTGRSATSVTVRARLLDRIREDAVPAVWTRLDFMSVDIEGSEGLELSSNDWRAHRPRVLVVEMLGATFSTPTTSRKGTLLKEHGYRTMPMPFHSGFFVSDASLLDSWTAGGLDEDRT